MERKVAVRITESSWRFAAAIKKLLPCHVEISRSRTVIHMNRDSKPCSGLKYVLCPDEDRERLVAPGHGAGGVVPEEGDLK